MKKKTFITICIGLMLVCLCACTGGHSSKSLTLNLSTGDSVKVELDTTGGGYDLKFEDNAIAVYKDDVKVLDGGFGSGEDWAYYYEIVDIDPDAEVLEKNDSKVVWKYNATDWVEYDTIVKVSDNTCVFVGGSISNETPEDMIAEALSRISFTLEQ